jgi:hypothetical protein
MCEQNVRLQAGNFVLNSKSTQKSNKRAVGILQQYLKERKRDKK